MNYAFDNDTRLIEVQVNIHFDDEVLSVTKDNYLISCNILEELSCDDSSPLGTVSSNELEFELYNQDDMFTPTNSSGAYYGKIKTNCKVDVLIREELSNGSWIKMGSYYVSDWKCYQYSNTVLVTCNDKMQSIINMKTPNVPIQSNISVKNFLTSLLIGIGLNGSDFEIDDTLSSQYMKYSYPHSSNLGEVLTEIAKSYLCYIYINRNNVLQVVSMLNFNSDVIATWSDDNQIVEPSVETSIIYNNTSVIVKYLNKYIGPVENMIELTKLTLPTGESILDTIITKEPIYEVDAVICECKNLILTSSISQSTNELSIVLDNKHVTEQENVDVTICGKAIKNNSTLYISKVIDNIDDDDRPLEISSEYIDNRDIATQVCDIMYNYITEDVPFIDLVIRGNPEIQVGSVVTINDTTNKINGDYIITSQKFTFNDSLECTVRCLNKSILKGVRICQ